VTILDIHTMYDKLPNIGPNIGSSNTEFMKLKSDCSLHPYRVKQIAPYYLPDMGTALKFFLGR